MNARLAVLTVELISLVPEQDLIEMFVSLEDYNWNGDFKGNTSCEYCHDKIEISTSIPTNTLEKAGGGSCNCNWGCDWFVSVNGGSSCKGCEPTSSGCGFFGTSGCYRDYDGERDDC